VGKQTIPSLRVLVNNNIRVRPALPCLACRPPFTFSLALRRSYLLPVYVGRSVLMESFSSALAHLEFVTPSGTRHPYFAVRSERMFARVTSYPSLGHETVVPSGKRAVCAP